MHVQTYNYICIVMCAYICTLLVAVARMVSIVTKSEINPAGKREHLLYIVGSFFNSDSMPLLIKQS